MKRFALLAPLLITLAAPAQAKTVECYCTDSTGDRVELGQSICLQVGGRMFTAQCQMSLNSPMWRETQEGCVTGSASGGFSPLGIDTLDEPIQPSAIHPEV